MKRTQFLAAGMAVFVLATEAAAGRQAKAAPNPVLVFEPAKGASEMSWTVWPSWT